MTERVRAVLEVTIPITACWYSLPGVPIIEESLRVDVCPSIRKRVPFDTQTLLSIERLRSNL